MKGYRRLLKTVQVVFKGDHHALHQGRKQLREEFQKNRFVTDADELAELYGGIDEVDEMLRFNIVQGKLNDKGNYEVIVTLT
jgi:hypothetical protein